MAVFQQIYFKINIDENVLLCTKCLQIKVILPNMQVACEKLEKVIQSSIIEHESGYSATINHPVTEEVQYNNTI